MLMVQGQKLLLLYKKVLQRWKIVFSFCDTFVDHPLKLTGKNLLPKLGM